MSQRDTVVHLIAGGVGGSAGALATCPLEVVKTRLQSSVATFHHVYSPSVNANVPTQPQRVRISTCTAAFRSSELLLSPSSTAEECSRHPSIGIWRCIKHIIETEGTRALFKGLGPNLVGVAPSRAIYFCTYSNTKGFLNEIWTPESSLIHMCSAVCAGVSACTATNPIWFVKTRLQLDQRKNCRLTATQCIRDIYRTKGLVGFYKGITASYFGVSETVIHFVIYEAIKAKLREYRHAGFDDQKTSRDFLEFMLAGATSKTCASCIAYPHEVARTRLRQEGNKYRNFWQTLSTVFREEGHRGLYRGLGTQLVRQIPNTAIMMATYEAVVYVMGCDSCAKTNMVADGDPMDNGSLSDSCCYEGD